MVERATAITPSLLIWARERSGLSVPEVANSMGKSVEVVEAWEAGEAWPTYNQLEALAERLYHRPVALFFLPEPPSEPEAQQEFRTLPDVDVRRLKADTRYVLRVALSLQDSLRELTGGVNPAPRLLLREVQEVKDKDIAGLAAWLRGFLGVPLPRQTAWRTNEDAMSAWRGAIERTGVFVFKQPFRQSEVSGFCLNDDEFPIIMVNNSTPHTRQIFTLFHELAHLIYGVNSITTADGSFVNRMSGQAQALEIRCNRLAAEFLVPANAFPWNQLDLDHLEQSVSEIASTFSVSREVILRRVLDAGRIEAATYQELAALWAQDAGREGEGGNYYYNQATYLGDSFLRLAFSRYRAGVIAAPELAEHLGVKAKNLSRFEDLVGGRL